MRGAQLRKYGAEVIKVCATGGVFSRNTEPGQQQMSEEEIRGRRGSAPVGPAGGGACAWRDGIKAAVRAGVNTIEHASLVDDEGIELATEHGVLAFDGYL